MTLPTKRAFTTSLISSLPPLTNQSQNPLREATANEKSVLLALHVLFPNELLPALDLLDRELVTRFLVRGHTEPPEVPLGTTVTATETPTEADTTFAGSQAPQREQQDPGTHVSRATGAVYHVRSARHQPSNSRFRDASSAAAAASTTTHYEVRPLSWNCSCPAFVFSAFPAAGDPSPSRHEGTAVEPRELPGDQENVDPTCVRQDEDLGWNVGGLSLGRDTPMCKHLLACVLAEHGGCFERFVKEEYVSPEEMAGWAAGWGG